MLKIVKRQLFLGHPILMNIYQIFSSLRSYLHFFVLFFFTFMEYFFWTPFNKRNQFLLYPPTEPLDSHFESNTGQIDRSNNFLQRCAVASKQSRIHSTRCAQYASENNWGQTDRRNDGPTDLRTDSTSYRDAQSHLKKRQKTRKRQWAEKDMKGGKAEKDVIL